VDTWQREELKKGTDNDKGETDEKRGTADSFSGFVSQATARKKKRRKQVGENRDAAAS